MSYLYLKENFRKDHHNVPKLNEIFVDMTEIINTHLKKYVNQIIKHNKKHIIACNEEKLL